MKTSTLLSLILTLCGLALQGRAIAQEGPGLLLHNGAAITDPIVYGYTDVYLEGDSVFARTQEVNLGNITADANGRAARSALALGSSTPVFSL